MVRETRHEYTLEQLATAAGMSVRNVRSYQTRGLIPAPTRQGRCSRYGPEHLTRLIEIRQARVRGASLSLIGRHLSRAGSLSADSLDRAWLPVPIAGAARGGQRAASLESVLVRAAGPGEAAMVDWLVGAGVFRRSGDRVVADRSVVMGLTSLVRRGVRVEQALQVTTAAAQAGNRVGTAIRSVLADCGGGEQPRGELVDLAADALLIAASAAIEGIDMTAE